MSLTISACIITYNEAEMIEFILRYILSIPHITEICLIDSGSNDGTLEILEKFSDYCKTINFSFKMGINPFKSFGEQRNISLDLASGEWIFSIDADETFSKGFNDILNIECRNPNICAFRIPAITLAGDENHYIHSGNFDPHIKVWRREGVRWVGDVHEHLIDPKGRDLHDTRAPDIIDTWNKYPNVLNKHYQLLKSNKSLIEKGKRWGELGMIQKSADRGIPIHETSWSEWKDNCKNVFPIRQIPDEWK